MNKTMILVAMAAVAMTSCNKNDFGEMEVPAGNGERVELKIGTGVEGMTTKSVISRAPIKTNDNVTADFLCFLASQDGSTINRDTLSNIYDKTTGTFVANAAAQTVSLTKILYYPGETGESILRAYVAGIHPAGGTITNQTVTFASADGQQDVMFAAPQDYNTAQAVKAQPTVLNGVSMKFAHMTSQLYFVADTLPHNPTTGGAFAGPVTIKSIEVVNATVPKSMNIVNGTIAWSNQQNLAVQNVSPSALPAHVDEKDGLVVCDPVMVNSSASIKLNVVITVNGVDKTFPNVQIKKKDGSNLVSAIGKKHKITLSFRAPAYEDTNRVTLNVTASVEEWGEGDSGSAEL